MEEERDIFRVSCLHASQHCFDLDRIRGYGLCAFCQKLLNKRHLSHKIVFTRRSLNVDGPAQFLRFQPCPFSHRDVERTRETRRHKRDVMRFIGSVIFRCRCATARDEHGKHD